MFYIAYIVDKDKTDYTGLESYIAEQIEKQEISWFPTFRALVLKDQTSEENEAAEMIKRIEEREIELSKNIGQMTKNITGLEEVAKFHHESKKKVGRVEKAEKEKEKESKIGKKNTILPEGIADPQKKYEVKDEEELMKIE